MDNKTFLIMLWTGIGIIIILVAILVILRLPEDSWIKDSRGVWVKHGSPYKTPDEVLSQEKAIVCAKYLYNSSNFEELSSQCLGSCDRYAVDIVHVSRTEEDNLEENQCEDFVRGELNQFIELDADGSVVRIV
jgi:hypothetical protein